MSSLEYTYFLFPSQGFRLTTIGSNNEVHLGQWCIGNPIHMKPGIVLGSLASEKGHRTPSGSELYTAIKQREGAACRHWTIVCDMLCVPPCRIHQGLLNTLRPRQMDAISQTTFPNGFSWMKVFEFQLKFNWSLFSRVQLTKFQHWFR